MQATYLQLNEKKNAVKGNENINEHAMQHRKAWENTLLPFKKKHKFSTEIMKIYKFYCVDAGGNSEDIDNYRPQTLNTEIVFTLGNRARFTEHDN